MLTTRGADSNQINRKKIVVLSRDVTGPSGFSDNGYSRLDDYQEE
jgi:hypothetical protein